jgi:hypothetical protein
MQKRRPARGRLRSRHDAREVSRSRLVHPRDDFMEVTKRIVGDEVDQAIEMVGQAIEMLVQASEMSGQAIEMLGQASEMLGDVDNIVDR